MLGAKDLTEIEEIAGDNGENVLEERKEIIEDLFEKAEEYVKTNIQLAKLKATDKVAEIVGSLVTQIAIVVLAFFFLLMVNIGIAFWLGSVLGQTYYGFLIVAGFYALLAIIVYAFRKSIIKTPISNSIISQILK
jgi:hypothetical protein